MPKNSCSVCLHESHAEIDKALLAGERANAVAAQYSVSSFSVGRHKRKHLFAAAAPIATDADEISVWLARADQIYTQATVDQDSRGMVSALTAGLKALDAKQKNQERQRESEATELGNNCHEWSEKQATQFLSYIDHVLAEGERLPHAEDEYGLVLAQQSAPDLHTIFLKLQANQDWLLRVKMFCAELFGERNHEFIQGQTAN
jgi:hypothetical protein